MPALWKRTIKFTQHQPYISKLVNCIPVLWMVRYCQLPFVHFYFYALFTTAYVRLSNISRTLNKLQDSKSWLIKAKLCKDDHTEFDVMMGDLYMASEEPEKAKELLSSSYLKVCCDASSLTRFVLIFCLTESHGCTNTRCQWKLPP